MDSPEKTVKDLTEALEASVDVFNADIPEIQKTMYAKVLTLVKELDTYKDGTIKLNAKNVKILLSVKQELKTLIVTDKYLKKISTFTDSFAAADTIQSAYFTTINAGFTINNSFNQIRKVSMDLVTEQLAGSGLQANILEPIRDILKTNISSGASFDALTEQLRGFLLEKDGEKGAFDRYARTYTTTAIFDYARAYNSVASDDLGLNWYVYSGGLQDTSRPFCRKMVEAKASCQPFFHESQIPELLKGHICNGNVGIYDKTGLPYGMREGTTVGNFKTLAGGWGCKHTVLGVSPSLVQKALRDKFK